MSATPRLDSYPQAPPLRAYLHRDHVGLFVAICIYLSLAGSYFFIVPMFEAPDEWTHTGHIEYIAEGNGLPVMLPGRGIWGGQQPPLYYAIGALLVQPFEIDGVKAYEEGGRNPHASLGFALDPGNKNNYLHRPTENFPYQGLALTVHVLRLYSISLGLITLVFTYLTAYEIFGGAKNNNSKWFALAVAFFMACQPMFAFITASVANEPANMAGVAVALWLTQRYVLYGPSHSPGRAIALGLSLGLISLAKMTGLSFGLVAVIAFLQVALATRKQPGAARLLWRDGLIIGLMFLAVGGWWYWRNYQLYGDFFQQGLYKLYFNVDPQPLSLSQFLYTLSTGEISFWATFGWLNIVAPDWVYSLYRIISRVGLVGVALICLNRLGIWLIKKWAGRQRHKQENVTLQNSCYLSPLLLHLIFPIALAFSLTRLVATEGGLQGRQLLPALGSIAIVIVWGWAGLTPARWQGMMGLILGGTLLGLALWLPYGLVKPAYVPPPVLTEAELPAGLTRLDFGFRGEMKLIGAEVGAEVVRPGERVPVTVYWQALQPMTTNYSVFVHLIGRDYENVGQLNTYPALGLRPTTTLQPGQIVKDIYPVLVNGGSAAPTRLLVNVGLFDFKEAGRPGIPPLTAAGEAANSSVGQLKLVPTEWPTIDATLSPLAQFGDNIELQAAELDACQNSDQLCQLTLTWLAQASPTADYTVFIQLWPEPPPATGPPFFGFDGPPLHNDYPTSLWAAQEVIRDAHPLDLSELPPGQYRMLVGLYNPTSGERLAASSQDRSWPDQAVEVERLLVK